MGYVHVCVDVCVCEGVRVYTHAHMHMPRYLSGRASTCTYMYLHIASGVPRIQILPEQLLYMYFFIIESVDSISKDERGFPLTQYITNGRIFRGGYTFTHFKHHHRVLRLISYSMSV